MWKVCFVLVTFAIAGCDAVERAAGGGAPETPAPPPDTRAPDAQLATVGQVVTFNTRQVTPAGNRSIAAATVRFGLHAPSWLEVARCTDPVTVGSCDVFECGSSAGTTELPVDVWPSAGDVGIRDTKGVDLTVRSYAGDRSYSFETDARAAWTPFVPIHVAATGHDALPFEADVVFPGTATLLSPTPDQVLGRGDPLEVRWTPSSEDIDFTVDAPRLGTGESCSAGQRCRQVAHCELRGGSATLPAALFDNMETTLQRARVEMRSIRTSRLTAGAYQVRVSAISDKTQLGIELR
jgi:hypothetical protein